MEYIISNFQFLESKEWNGTYYFGDFVVRGNCLTLIEGEIFGKEIIDNNSNININLEKLLSSNILGAFNIICYDYKSRIIDIKNDKIGKYPIYYFNDGKNIMVSNNFWKVVENINGKKEINKTHIYSRLLMFGDVEPDSTFFNEIKKLRAATQLSIDLNSNKISHKKYWDLIQKVDENISVNDAVSQLDNSLNKTMQLIKNKYKNELFYFGNSGGLDSRLVPIYAKQNDIKISGYYIGSKASKYYLKSLSYKSSYKISKLYKFNHKQITFNSDNYEDRMLLDIRNNPFSMSQITKNPYEKLLDTDLMFCGGNGYMVSNDSGTWHRFSKTSTIIEKKKFFRKLLLKTRSIPINGQENFLNMFPNEITQKLYNSIDKFVDNNAYKDNISMIRSFHQTIYNTLSPNGGFESINRTKKSFYLYYPYAFENSFTWKSEYFNNRLILGKLISKKSSKLASIPDQRFNVIGGKKYWLYRGIVRRLRSTGLEYENWIKDGSFIKYANKVLQRNNPLVKELGLSKILNIETYMNYHPFISLDIIKIKKILDIIYFNEYENLHKKEFQIK